MSIAEASLADSSTLDHEDPSSVRAQSSSDEEIDLASGLTRNQAWNLYASHFLSTWNVRGYEFAVIIFTAAAYPDTLVAVAIRGIIRTIASICFSPSVGRWVDQSPNRLKTLLTTISFNRVAVVTASLLWYLMVDPAAPLRRIVGTNTILFGLSGEVILKGIIFSILLFLGIIEALSALGNTLSMERDWVLAAAAPSGKPYDLTHLNSAMRRIDLICKLIAPIMIAQVISIASVKTGVLVIGLTNLTSWGVEIWCASRVWALNPRVRAEKSVIEELDVEISHPTLPRKMILGLQRYIRDIQNYFSTTIWIPSMALSLLHLSVLSYGATFITFLLNVGTSLDVITIARAAGSVVEISSTVVTPIGVRHLGKAYKHSANDDFSTPLIEDDSEEVYRTEVGLERVGLWGLSWQLLNLIPVVLALLALSGSAIPIPFLQPLSHRMSAPLGASQPVLIFAMFFFLSISRLGLWIYDLTTQQLTQTMTPPSQRSSFTGVEYSFVSFFTLIQNVITIFIHRPEQFKWIALMSFGTVIVSTVVYAGWVWKMRGHLVHWEKFSKISKCCDVRERF